MNTKISCIILLFTCLSEFSIAQVGDTTDTEKSNYYVGIGFSTVSHHIYYKNPKANGSVTSGYFAPLSISLGYRISRRTSVQVGIAYGGGSDHLNWSPGSKDTLMNDTNSRTHVLAMPVTMRYTFFKAFKRFPVYGTATVMPAYGFTKTSNVETRHQVSTTSTTRDSGVNTFFTAGIGLEYKISKRFNGFFEYHAYKHNLTGKNSAFYDWDIGGRGVDRIVRTVGLGVNYSI